MFAGCFYQHKSPKNPKELDKNCGLIYLGAQLDLLEAVFVIKNATTFYINLKAQLHEKTTPQTGLC